MIAKSHHLVYLEAAKKRVDRKQNTLYCGGDGWKWARTFAEANVKPPESSGLDTSDPIALGECSDGMNSVLKFRCAHVELISSKEKANPGFWYNPKFPDVYIPETLENIDADAIVRLDSICEPSTRHGITKHGVIVICDSGLYGPPGLFRNISSKSKPSSSGHRNRRSVPTWGSSNA